MSWKLQVGHEADLSNLLLPLNGCVFSWTIILVQKSCLSHLNNIIIGQMMHFRMTVTPHEKLTILSSTLFHKSFDCGYNAFITKLIASHGPCWDDMIRDVDQMDYDSLECFEYLVSDSHLCSKPYCYNWYQSSLCSFDGKLIFFNPEHRWKLICIICVQYKCCD